MTDKTPNSEGCSKQAETKRKSHLFQKGQSGNPAGRPVGTGSKVFLSVAFYKLLEGAIKKHGEAVMKTLAEEHPVTFATMIAGLMPAESNVSVHRTTVSGDISETAEWLERIARAGTSSAPERSLPN